MSDSSIIESPFMSWEAVIRFIISLFPCFLGGGGAEVIGWDLIFSVSGLWNVDVVDGGRCCF